MGKSILAHEWTRPHGQRAGLRPSWLASMLARDRHQDGQAGPSLVGGTMALQGASRSRWLKILFPICLYCLNCTKFGQLIVKKIIKIVATRCQILRLKLCKIYQIRFRLGFRPRPRGSGSYSAYPNTLAGF